MEHSWDPLSIDSVTERFAPFDVDWWVAGGLAIDLFLGWQTREHEDIDLELFKSDCDVLFDVFDGWDLVFVSEGQLQQWSRGEAVPPGVFGVWGRPTRDSPWAVEVMLADGDHEVWRFRRDNRISVPRPDLTHESAEGIRYCTPEVQLLFKAKKHRRKDDADMVRCLHRLNSDQRGWLSDALRRSEPTHAWLDLIAQAEIGGTE